MIYSSKRKFVAFIFGSILAGVSSIATAKHLIHSEFSVNLDAEAAAKADQLKPALHEEYEKVLALVHHMNHLGFHHHDHKIHRELYRTAEGMYHVPSTHTHHYGHPLKHHGHHHGAAHHEHHHGAGHHEHHHGAAHHEHHHGAAHHEHHHGAAHHEHHHGAAHHEHHHGAAHHEHHHGHHKKHKVHHHTAHTQEQLDAAM